MINNDENQNGKYTFLSISLQLLNASCQLGLQRISYACIRGMVGQWSGYQGESKNLPVVTSSPESLHHNTIITCRVVQQTGPSIIVQSFSFFNFSFRTRSSLCSVCLYSCMLKEIYQYLFPKYQHCQYHHKNLTPIQHLSTPDEFCMHSTF